jgi:hypothetical protein
MHPEHQGLRIKNKRTKKTKHNRTFLQKVFSIYECSLNFGKEFETPRIWSFGGDQEARDLRR